MANQDHVTSLLLSLPGSVEEYPFGPHVSVYKLSGKIFALLSTDKDPREISLKGKPEEAELLRHMYEGIRPGYHLNKRHWNTVTLDGSVPEDVVLEMIRDSYSLILSALPKAERSRYNGGS
jgi:predicted DNA-binding protein (MmcQ/YjbR family)